LLNTGLNTVTAARVISSWIDMLAGLAKFGIFSTPPDFWARAAALPKAISSTAAVAANLGKDRFMRSSIAVI